MDKAHFELVTETYPPEVNGVALTVQALESGLRGLGHQVGLVRPVQPIESDIRSLDELRVPSAPIPRYPGLRFGLPATRKLCARWAARRPDAIYIATEGPLGWSAMRAAHKLGIPVATGFHTRFDDYVGRYGAGFLSPLVLAWLRRFHNRGDATIVPTLELQSSLALQGFRNMAKLGRAIDLRQFHPGWRDPALRSSWNVGDRDLAIIHVGRIAAEKNLPLAEKAFRAVKHDHPRARFIWVGDGPERAALQARNPDFIFTGTLRGDALARHFASADVFCFPSLSETFGNVTLEAMASGLATVAFNYGAAREHLRDGEHGAAVPFGDEAAFVESLRRICSHPELPAMGASARSALSGHTPEAIAVEFAGLLKGLKQHRRAA